MYGFTLLGLFLTPPSLKKLRWLFPLWFLITNAVLFSNIWIYHLYGRQLLFIILNQAGWIFISAYFLVAMRQGLIKIDTSQWIRWQSFRLMGAKYYFLLYAYTIPLGFCLEMAVLESLVGATAFLISLWYKNNPKRAWGFLLAWNILGFLSVWRFNLKFNSTLFYGPIGADQVDISNYFSLFPEIWIVSFWVPLSLTIHIVLFLQLLGRQR